MNPSICIITVTYGNRLEFIRKSLEKAVKCENVKKIIVIDNDSNPDINSLNIINKWNKVKVIKNQNNLGSSGGFKKGIETYLDEPSEDFILFLDDDNVICESTIPELLIAYKKVGNDYQNIGLLCVRKEMKKYWLIANGKLSADILNNYSPFARFSVIDLYSKFKYRFFSRFNHHQPKPNKLIQIDNGYWSGLFITRDALLNCKLPNEKFFVYKDDHEYIYNLRQKGLKLFLVTNAVLLELDSSWATNSSKTIFSFPEFNGPAFRAYYSIRNTVYFEEHTLKDSSIIRWLNKKIYFSILFLKLYFVDRERYKLLMTAIEDGITQNMGRNDKY